jgi:hypothetical protein
MRMLFWLFGKAIRRHIEATRERPKGFDGMEYAYTIEDVDYFTWVDLSMMPASRQKHIERCLKFIDTHISDKVLDEHLDLLEDQWATAVKGGKEAPKALARAAHITQELRKRPKDIIPEEVFYDLCALFVSFKGEDPRTFDPATHTQKIEAIAKAGRAGHDFFTRPPELRRLLVSLPGGVRSFADMLISWKVQELRRQALTELHRKRL